jgi:hypothetical protein
VSEGEDRRELIRRCYAAFNARDIDTALAGMRPDVDWPNAIEGGRVRGHDAVRQYWNRQFEVIDPQVQPQGFSEDEASALVVEVHQVVRDAEGNVVADEQVEHVYAFEEGLIARMDIRRAPAGGA